MRHFATIKNDHEDFEDPSTITLTCKGIKKFIAYDSFYPQKRSVDLGRQFIKSYSTNFDGYNQIFLDPMFAPGVFYNTIKSGIAVDYPLFGTNDLTMSAYIPTGSKAEARLDYSGDPGDQPRDGEVVVVRSKTFTFRNSPSANTDVQIDEAPSTDTTFA